MKRSNINRLTSVLQSSEIKEQDSLIWWKDPEGEDLEKKQIESLANRAIDSNSIANLMEVSQTSVFPKAVGDENKKSASSKVSSSSANTHQIQRYSNYKSQIGETPQNRYSNIESQEEDVLASNINNKFKLKRYNDGIIKKRKPFKLAEPLDPYKITYENPDNLELSRSKSPVKKYFKFFKGT